MTKKVVSRMEKLIHDEEKMKWHDYLIGAALLALYVLVGLALWRTLTLMNA